MLEVAIYNTDGEQIDTLQIDEQRFGGDVNPALLKQAVVIYHANQHQGSAATKGRSAVEGSKRKLFRQKGTGNARRGNIRTPVMRGGGVTFSKTPHHPRVRLPKKMRRRALDSALLAKMLGSNLLLVDGLKLDQPRTKTIVGMLDRMKVNRSCLLTLNGRDDVIYRSARNIPRMMVRTVEELNAYDVVNRQKMVMTRDAMDSLLEGR